MSILDLFKRDTVKEDAILLAQEMVTESRRIKKAATIYSEQAIETLPDNFADLVHERYVEKCVDAEDIVNYEPVRWGGDYTTAAYPGPPITTVCSTAMEPGGFFPTPTHRITPEPVEWRCEGCGSVMLQEHRTCQECGKPRHFLYGEESKESVVKGKTNSPSDSPFVILTSDGKTK